MNVYLIHGENRLDSYQRLEEYIKKARSKGWDVKEIDDQNQNIIDTLREVGLFETKRLIVVKKYSILNEKSLKFINEFTGDTEVIVYHEGTIPQAFAKKLKNVRKNEVFKLSKSLWKFIDSFYPGNVNNCLKYFQESVNSDPVELVFSILSGQLKDLFIVLYSNESLPYPPWRLYKLKDQAEKFGKDNIKSVIQDLSDIDLKVKSTSTNLKDELDLFIMTKLK